MTADRASMSDTAAVRSGSLAAWAVAVRPRSLLVAISPVLVGATMGFERTGRIDWLAAVLVLSAALLMQVITNMQNDVGYTVRGGDSSGTRTGLPRATANGWLSVRHVRGAIVLTALLSVAVGLALVAYRGWPVLAIGSASLLAALAYMGGPRPIAYTPLGELTVFVFFGLVAVSGSQYLQAGQQYGNMASQGGALAGQEASINQNISNLMLQQGQARNQAAQTAAGIYGQQAQQYQGQAQGIGQLASQQFGIGQQQAQGLGALGGQLGQLGVQQGALGQTAQALQQGDINFLYNTGQAGQAFNQQRLDAQRATELQKIYAPYQQAGFLSDIYKGAPSTQMSTAVASQPTASPFQQVVGIGLGTVSTAAAAKKANLFG